MKSYSFRFQLSILEYDIDHIHR